MNNSNYFDKLQFPLIYVIFFNVQKKKNCRKCTFILNIIWILSVYNFDSLSYNNSWLFSLLVSLPTEYHNGTVMCLTFSRHLLLSALGQCCSWFIPILLYLFFSSSYCYNIETDENYIYMYFFSLLGILYDICNI